MQNGIKNSERPHGGTDVVNQFLYMTVEEFSLWYGHRPRPRAVCADGFTISIQAESGAYCRPRITNAFECGELYTHVELGYPSEKEALIIDYAEDPHDLINTVYGYVPINVVNEVIDKHGGFDRDFWNSTNWKFMSRMDQGV